MTLTKRAIENMFLQNVPDAKIEVLAEEPSEWKHCCNGVGATLLKPIQINNMGVVIKYAVCPCCHKILYIADYSGAIPFRAAPDGSVLPMGDSYY